MLGAFIHEVEAQRGKKISALDADNLLAAAEAILAELEVPSQDSGDDSNS